MRIAMTVLLTTLALCSIFVFFSVKYTGWEIKFELSSHNKELTFLRNQYYKQAMEINKLTKKDRIMNRIPRARPSFEEAKIMGIKETEK